MYHYQLVGRARARLEEEPDAFGLRERARERLRAAVPVRLGRGVGVFSR